MIQLPRQSQLAESTSHTILDVTNSILHLMQLTAGQAKLPPQSGRSPRLVTFLCKNSKNLMELISFLIVLDPENMHHNSASRQKAGISFSESCRSIPLQIITVDEGPKLKIPLDCNSSGPRRASAMPRSALHLCCGTTLRIFET